MQRKFKEKIKKQKEEEKIEKERAKDIKTFSKKRTSFT